MDEEHREVVALRGVAHEPGDEPLDVLQVGLGRLPPVQCFDYTFFAKLLMHDVLRFREPVGIQEDRIVVAERHLLLHIIPAADDSQGQVGFDREFPDAVGEGERRIVSGVAVTQITGGEVLNAAEERHEHVVLVHGRQAVVDGAHDEPGAVFLGRQGAERSARHGHHERSRDSLSAHVADAEEQLVVPDEEVVQVSAHFLGRNDGRRHVQVVPFGESVRNHGHLDIAGDPEFPLQALPPFVQFPVFRLALEERAEDQDEHRHAQQLEQPHQPVGAPDVSVDVVFGDGDAHRPSGPLHGRIVDVALLPFIHQFLMAGLPCQHGQVHFLEFLVVPHLVHHFVHRLLHDQFPVLADHEPAGAADHQAGGMGIDADVAHEVRQPVQRDVGRQHGRRNAFLILDRDGERRHQHLAAARVDIRLRPVSAVRLDRFPEPLLGRIIIFRRGQGQENQAAVPMEYIRGEQRTLPVISRDQGDGGTQDDGVVLDDTAAHAREAVGKIQAPARDPDAVPDGGLGLVDDVHDLVPGGLQLGFGPPGSLLLEFLLRIVVLDEGRGLQRDGGDDDEQDTRRRGSPVVGAGTAHRTEDRAFRNTGIGCPMSRSMIRVLRPA